MMRNSWRFSSLAAGIGACLWLMGCAAKKEADPGATVTVDVAPVLNAPIQRTVRADAVLYPVQQAAIAAKISAPIRRFYVERGSRVRAGQLLVELESQDLIGAAKESQAAYELAEANYETTARATVPQEGQKAELDVRVAKDTLDAAASGVRQPPASASRKARSRRKTSTMRRSTSVRRRNQYEIARKRLEDLQGFGKDQALKAAAAQRDAARGAIRDACRHSSSYAQITSPIDGVVTDRPLYAGEIRFERQSHSHRHGSVADRRPRCTSPPSEAAELKVGDDASSSARRRSRPRQSDADQPRARRRRARPSKSGFRPPTRTAA